MAVSLPIIMALSLLSLLIHPTFSITCKSQTFTNKKTFDKCNDLSTLGATLHWTFDPSKSTLYMAYTATPPKPEGWVSWALNPMGSGMVGAQSLIAFKPTTSGPISVDTYDIMSYHAITKGPISYNVSALSAEESSNGDITIFATWALPSGETTFNQVWQVGPVLGGKPNKHDFEQANLEARMKLNLNAAGGPAGAPELASRGPTGAPELVVGGNDTGAAAPVPAPSQKGEAEGLVPIMSFGVALVALVVSLL